MVVQIELASLAIPPMVQRRWNLRAVDAIVGIHINVVAFIFALDLVDVDVDLWLCAEKAESRDVARGRLVLHEGLLGLRGLREFAALVA